MKDNTDYSVEQLSQKFIDEKFPMSIGFTDAERLLLKSGYQCGFNDANKPETNAFTVSEEEIVKAYCHAVEQESVHPLNGRECWISGIIWMQEQLNKKS